MLRPDRTQSAGLTPAAGPRRPLVYDATHLVARLNRRALTGMDRVDLLYARRYAEDKGLAGGLHYGLREPHLWSPARLRRLVARFHRKVGEDDALPDDATWNDLRAWIADPSGQRQLPGELICRSVDEGPRALADQLFLRLIDDFGASVPEGAIYLNVAQAGFEYHRFFDWLARRPDVTPLFVVHDLLPLDHPEFFRAGYWQRFDRRVQTIVRHAKAVITTSAVVRDRLAEEYERRRKPAPPMIVRHLPSPLGARRDREDDDPLLAEAPYFVMVGTIEPRKNHQLILNIWKELGPEAPKLVLVGVDGWDHEHVLRMLDRCPALRRTVQRVSGLPRRALRRLVANARAVLMPSYAEGYGLPVVEALNLGAPLIASDIAIFHETAGASATYLSPIDGLGWKNAILDFAKPDFPRRREALRAAAGCTAPTEADYFAAIDNFIAAL
ncbi:glycosyltransferase family 4 protein [Rhodoblastus acidophilus]|uniref:Glycosyltransferase family 4 protein n=1 Tax=Candidatus Rhodoblastus alkanivorans TaxID=2954117 RepID=A0ABS9Z362_9HYPH|nr:glycosyltransferase family 1 protein [Candidatus Rhodoblastus alkanivorans]MCI4677318.1 glycosyltransferase family 4 protein [Candidatus Rhodoblastus alkanivorans]MCI4682053.1 glycosyltransferase family 4 protein [Candidatus Rhodoblastus alkanivorans]MDI4639355.1 glycosyltransferase family 4 protein [Rhodoblastus acidophilus]